MTPKQLRKVQGEEEERIKAGDRIRGYWTHNGRRMKAMGIVNTIAKDHITMKLSMGLKYSTYPYEKGWIVYIPKTASQEWSIDNRFEIFRGQAD